MDCEWCSVCCTRHLESRDCPGDLLATGDERHGWRVNAETPTGIEACGVLIAPSRDLWRARILTYPNILWSIPGGGGAIKFVGKTPREAERQAVAFLREHIRARGYTMRPEVAPVQALGVAPEAVPSMTPAPDGSPARRKVRFLAIRYGVSNITEVGGTGNLSETGLFIITNAPERAGTHLNMLIDTGQANVDLRGQVRWMSARPHSGRSPGMGVQLEAPPPRYVNYVRSLQ